MTTINNIAVSEVRENIKAWYQQYKEDANNHNQALDLDTTTNNLLDKLFSHYNWVNSLDARVELFMFVQNIIKTVLEEKENTLYLDNRRERSISAINQYVDTKVLDYVMTDTTTVLCYLIYDVCIQFAILPTPNNLHKVCSLIKKLLATDKYHDIPFDTLPPYAPSPLQFAVLQQQIEKAHAHKPKNKYYVEKVSLFITQEIVKWGLYDTHHTLVAIGDNKEKLEAIVKVLNAEAKN